MYNKKTNEKKKHIRLTHYDTLQSQKKLRKLLKEKTINPTPLSNDERIEWEQLIADSYLNWGLKCNVYHERSDIRLKLGNLHTLALKMMDYDDTGTEISSGNKIYNIELKTLWDLIYKSSLNVFPYALDEALHISKEILEREDPGSYQFSYKKKLDRYENNSEGENP